MRKFLLLLGPTASGKSELGFQLAQRLKAPLFNGDTIQCYKFVEVGTAKPSRKLREAEDVHLFDWMEPPMKLTARQYAERAWHLVDGLEKDLFVFVGGSGFYLKALEKGLLEAPAGNEALRASLAAEISERGEEALYEELRSLDPERAQKISPKDHYRLIRSLEVLRSGVRTFSEMEEMRSKELGGLEARGKVFKLALQAPREWLHERVRRRTQEMLASGWIEEVQDLLAQGLEEWWPLKSVGYSEIVAHLRGELSRGDLEEEIVKKTMGLAKKQNTWIRSLKDVLVLDATKSGDELMDQVLRSVFGEGS